MKIEELLEKYEIDNVEDFEPKFYTQNLVNKKSIEKEAIKNLNKRYPKDQQIQVVNYDEIGIVEWVAKDCFEIENNKIIRCE